MSKRTKSKPKERYDTVINPLTHRFIRSGGALHKKLILAGEMDNIITVTRRTRKKKLVKKMEELDLEESRSRDSSSSSQDEIKIKKKSRLRKRNDRRR